jgi:calcium/calmodulin-dependent protein kinase kinase 2
MRAIKKFKSLLKPKDDAVPPQEPTPATEQGESLTPQPLGGTAEKLKENETPEESTEDHITKILKEREQFLKSTRGGKLKLGMAAKTDTTAPLAERSETLLLGIGTGSIDSFDAELAPFNVVSDSPTAVDFNIYDRAFRDEVDRIKRSTSRKGSRHSGKVYLTKLSERNNSIGSAASDATIVNPSGGSENDTTPGSSLSTLASQPKGPPRLADLVAQAMTDAKAQSQ